MVVIKQRPLPSAFKLYIGSAWMMLSRSFAEFCVVGGTISLGHSSSTSRTFVSSPEGYFQTLICNSEPYKNSTINHDLHYITWDTPPKQHPRSLTLKDYSKMVQSGRSFARKFKENDPILSRIDRRLLQRKGSKQFSRGGWCDSRVAGGKVLRGCSEFVPGRHGDLNPGVGSKRLLNWPRKLNSTRYSAKYQCKCHMY